MNLLIKTIIANIVITMPMINNIYFKGIDNKYLLQRLEEFKKARYERAQQIVKKLNTSGRYSSITKRSIEIIVEELRSRLAD